MRERLHNSVKKYFRTKLSLSGMQNLTGSIPSRYVRTSFMPQTSLGEGSQPDSKNGWKSSPVSPRPSQTNGPRDLNLDRRMRILKVKQQMELSLPNVWMRYPFQERRPHQPAQRQSPTLCTPHTSLKLQTLFDLKKKSTSKNILRK